NEILLDIESDLIEDNFKDQNDENLEIDLTLKFNDYLSKWLDILQQEINSENELDDDLYDFDIDIENIEHPV
ncbi:4078_t:CDS:1, partial [Funneliformis caledonium]